MAEKNMRQPTPPSPPPVDLDRTPPRNTYYDKVAARYRTAKYLTLFVLVAVILGGLFMGSGSVTYANFVYLLRDFDTVPSVKTIYSVMPKAEGIGMAVCNRLMKAAGFTVLNLSNNED